MGFEDLANLSGKGGSVFDQAFGGNSEKGGSVFDQAFGGNGNNGSVFDQAFGGNGSQEVNLLKSNHFNIKAQNLGNAGLIESKMGLIAKREDLNFGDISLAEMYNDKSMDTRAMGGLYNVTLSDMYSDKKTFLATQGALSMGGLILDDDKELSNSYKSMFIPEAELQENIYTKKENKIEEIKLEENKTTDIFKKEETKENNLEKNKIEIKAENSKIIEIKHIPNEKKESKSIFLNNEEEKEEKKYKVEYKEEQKNTKIKKKKREDEEFVIDTLSITKNSIQENLLKKPKPEKVISDIEAFYKQELEEFLNS